MRFTKMYDLGEQVLLCLLAIAFIGYVILTRRSIHKVNGSISSILTNWDSPYIFDFAIVRGNQSCPREFEIASQYTFPGTTSYCECELIPMIPASGYYVKRTCKTSSHFFVQLGCRELQYQPKNLTVWKDNTKLCKRTLKELNFNNYLLNKSREGDCANGTMRCGPDKEISICIPVTLGKCPVSEIYIGDSNPNTSRFTESIKDVFGKNLYIARGTGLPLSILKYEEYWPCVDPSLLSLTPDRYMSVLLENPKEHCKRDMRYTRFEKLDEQDFYSANHLDIKHLKRANLVSSDVNYWMFTQNSIELKPVCRDEVRDYHEFGENMSSAKRSVNYLFIFSILYLIAFVILVIWGAVSIFFSIYQSDWSSRTFIAIFLALISIVLILIQEQKINHSETNQFNATRDYCSDIFTNSIMRETREEFKYMKACIYEAMLVCSSLIIGYLIAVLIHFISLKNELTPSLSQPQDENGETVQLIPTGGQTRPNYGTIELPNNQNPLLNEHSARNNQLNQTHDEERLGLIA